MAFARQSYMNKLQEQSSTTTSSSTYSAAAIDETLSKQTQKLYNGAVGIDFHNLQKTGNLANSAVLRMLEEEESGRTGHKIDPDPYNPWINRYMEHLSSKEKKLSVDDIKKLSDGPPGHLKWIPEELPPSIPVVRRPSPGRLKRVAWPPPPETRDFDSIYQNPESYQVVSPPLSGPQAFSPPPQRAFSPPQAIQSPPLRTQPTPPLGGISQATPPPGNAQSFSPPPQAFSPVNFEPPKSKVVLLPQAPVKQRPPPVFASQPATTSIQGGARMRGDQKWPPENVKQQAAAENEARVALAKGPAFRPRKVKKDYSTFFAQNALNPTYPGYRPPPGTQHYIEEGTSNL